MRLIGENVGFLRDVAELANSAEAPFRIKERLLLLML